ncbi:GNAT family N-acetyltransferase [Leucobacter sp. HY1908]
MPLGREIEQPAPRYAGRVGLQLVRARDAVTLARLLTENRSWLTPWEATHPSGRGVVPGSGSMRPVIKLLRKQLRAGAGVPFVITYDGAIVGQLSVAEVSGGALQACQIGYWVAEEAAGRGIAPAAVALAIDYVFEELGLHRIEVCIRPENAASLRVVEKLGLAYEGRRQAYIHIDGKWCDHDCFVVVRDRVPPQVAEVLSLAVTG